MCHFSTASPWLSSDNYGITTRVKLKPSTVSGYKTERDTQHLQVLKSHLQKGKAFSASLLSHLKEESQVGTKEGCGECFFPSHLYRWSFIRMAAGRGASEALWSKTALPFHKRGMLSSLQASSR